MPRRRRTDTSVGAGKLPPDVKVTRKRTADGTVKVYYYRRSTGKKIEGEPGTFLFEQSWRAAGIPKDEPGPEPAETIGEFALLIRRFQKSPEANKASADSIKQRNRYLTKIEDRFGYMTLSDLQDDRACEEFFEWRDEMAHVPVKADKAIQTLNQVLKWAKSRKLIKVNQAEDVTKLVDNRESLRRNRAKLVYTPAMVDTLFEVLRPCVRVAFLLALYTGARMGDLCGFRWNMIDSDGWLIYTPSKTRHSTGIEVHVPTFALPPLKALLESLPRRPHGHILSSDYGRKMSKDTLKKHWAEDRNKTSIRLHWHDIRGTTVTRLLAAGCTHAEVASITGHALTSPVAGMTQDQARSLARYGAINRDMALNAYRKWTAAEFSDFTADDNVIPLQRRKAPAA